MQDNWKSVTTKLSENEFDAFSRLASLNRAYKSSMRGYKSAMLREIIRAFIQRNMSTVVHLRLFSKHCSLRFDEHDEHEEFLGLYPKIRQAIELIRDAQNNAIKLALDD